LFYCRSIFYHFVGDSCEFGNKCRDGCLWIYECLKGIYYIFSIKLYRCYFGDMMSVFTESSCFNIDDDVVFIVQNDWYNNKKLLMQFLNSGPEGVEPSTRSFVPYCCGVPLSYRVIIFLYVVNLFICHDFFIVLSNWVASFFVSQGKYHRSLKSQILFVVYVSPCWCWYILFSILLVYPQ
jgi:hypothetical protein